MRTLHPAWFQGKRVSHWAGLAYKAREGLLGAAWPKLDGSRLSLGCFQLDDVDAIEQTIGESVPKPKKSPKIKRIAFGVLSANVRTLRESAEAKRNNARDIVHSAPGAIRVIAEQFHAEGILIAGLQEGRARNTGQSMVGTYARFAAGPQTEKTGDVELWVATDIPVVPGKPNSFLKPSDVSIVAAQQRWMSRLSGRDGSMSMC